MYTPPPSQLFTRAHGQYKHCKASRLINAPIQPPYLFSPAVVLIRPCQFSSCMLCSRGHVFLVFWPCGKEGKGYSFPRGSPSQFGTNSSCIAGINLSYYSDCTIREVLKLKLVCHASFVHRINYRCL